MPGDVCRELTLELGPPLRLASGWARAVGAARASAAARTRVRIRLTASVGPPDARDDESGYHEQDPDHTRDCVRPACGGFGAMHAAGRGVGE
jgi:hypothetical protein